MELKPGFKGMRVVAIKPSKASRRSEIVLLFDNDRLFKYRNVSEAEVRRLLQSHPDSDHNLSFEVGSRIIDESYSAIISDHVETSDPPKTLLWLLSFLLRTQERDGALGDLVEKYHYQCREFGQRKADQWFLLQVFRSVFPLIMRFCGRIGWVILGEWIKKHIS